MKRAISSVVIAVAVWMTAELVRAVDGLEIRVQGPDVVLEWPSAEGETFLITYRATYETNTPWSWLSTNWPAASGTNRTTFVHTNGADCSGGSGMAMTAEGGGSATGTSASEKSPKESSEELAEWAKEFISYEFPKLHWDEKTQVSIAESYPGILPSLPWDETVQEEIICQHEAEAKRLSDNGANTALMSGENGCVPSGFYKVAKEGIHFIGLTNGTTLTGEVFLPLEVGTTVNEPLVFEVIADGVPIPQATIERLSDGSLAAKFNSAFFPNGTSQIWPRAEYGFDQPPLRSHTNTVSMYNDVAFFDFTTSFGDHIWFYAELTVVTADFEIRIHDEQGNYLASIVDSTSDGLINGIWIPEIGGMPVTNETLQATFLVTPTGGGGTSTGGPLVLKKETAISGNWFIVARAEDFNDGTPDNYHEAVYQGVVNVIGHPIYDDPYELSPGNIPFGGSTFWFTDDTRTNLLEYLADSAYGNFFWWGHGNPTAIGYTYHGADPATNKVGITAAEVAALLGNTNKIGRPYHLVFIHGCKAAGGQAWPKAFGVLPVPTVKQAYANNGTRPRAFVSARENALLVSESSQLFYAESLAGFFSLWMLGATVADSLYEATRPQEPGETRIPLSEAGKWIVYGAVDLRREDVSP